jgi:hypothetical protein
MPLDSERFSEIMNDLSRKAKNPMDYVAPLAGRMRLEPVIEMWEEPSFEPRIAWGVFALYDPRVNQTNLEPFVIEATWDDMEERRRIANLVEDPGVLEPIFSVVKAPLDRERFTTLMDASRQISIPISLVESRSGFDGTDYGLKIDGFSYSVNVRWWQEGPDTWNKLSEWAFEFRAFLVNSIRETNSLSKPNSET